jgi:hypothetical protein
MNDDRHGPGVRIRLPVLLATGSLAGVDIDLLRPHRRCRLT